MKLGSFVEAGIYGLIARGAGEPKGHEWHPPVPGRDGELHILDPDR